MSAEPLPLADAQRRLGRPGRPRRDTPADTAPTRTRVESGADGGAPDRQSGRPALTAEARRELALRKILSIQPRLLSLAGAGRYLSLERSSVLALEEAGVIHRAKIIVRGRVIRKRLFDRLALDALVSGWTA